MVLKALPFFLLFLNVKLESNLFRPKTIRIYRFNGTCPGHENAPIQYTDIQLVNVNRTFHVSMNVHVSRNINNGLKLCLYLSRCTNRESLDSCETYNTIKINHFCELMVGDKKPWTPFVKLFTPPMKCPLKKALYEVKDGTFDGAAFMRFPVFDWYWKILVNILDESTGEILLCASLEGQIAPI